MEPLTDLPEALRDWAAAFDRDECAKETILDALRMAADRIEWLEARLPPSENTQP